MTVTISYAPTNDGRVQSVDSNYNTALQGNGTKNVDTTGATLGSFGQRAATNYSVYQYFVEFGQAFDTNYVVVDAQFVFTCATNTGASVFRNMEIREHNWGPTVEGFNFRTPSQLSSEPLLALAATVNEIAEEAVFRCGDGEGLRSRLDSSGTIKCVVSTSRNRQSQAPSGNEWTQVYTANTSGTAKDPHLVYTSVRKTLLNRVLGSQIQLSDGSHVFAESQFTDHQAQATAIKHRHADGTGETTIYTNNEANRRIGAQCYALVADDSDNVYYITAFEGSNQLHVRAFLKGSGYTWSQTGSGWFVSLPWYTNYTNQVVAVWHPVGGVAGTIVAIAGHPTTYQGTVNAYALINVDHIRFGSGSILRDNGSATFAGLLYPSNPPENFNNNPPNAHGSQIDIARSPGSDTKGQVLAASQNATYLIPNYVSVARYTLLSDGSGFADVVKSNRSDTVKAKITKDANAKCRVFGTSSTGFVTVVADADVGAGIVVAHFNIYSTSRANNITLIDVAYLNPDIVPSMPGEGTLARSSAWDAVYHPDDNTIWVYYFDTANAQRLMRTGVDVSTGLPNQSEIEVSAAVGAVGSTNRTIRVHRDTTHGTPALISVANDDAGTHSMIYLTDTLNIAPNAPILVAKNNFDATGSADFEWEFSDPDASDAQTAYQLQIDQVSNGITVHDSGKVASATESHTVPASTLVNGVEYQWRVMTWDRLDVASPWSDYGTFETSASGNVTIVDPATDNPPNANTDQYLVEWSVSGAVQDGYLVEVYRTDTEALVYGSGWVTSTDTTHLIEGMVSDIEHRIEVTIRDSALVESSTATRLITPSFASPEKPFITVVAEPSNARIVLEVFNPEPPMASEVLNTNPDFEVNVSGWEGDNGAAIEHSTAQAVEGVGSALVTPDGVTDFTRIRTAPTSAIPVDVGQTYRFAPWVYAPNGLDEVAAQIIWRASDGQEFAASTGATMAAPAGQWMQLDVTAEAPSSFGGAVDALASVVLNFNSGSVAATGDTYHVDDAEFFVPSDISQVHENQIYRRLAGTQDSWRQVAEVGVNGTYYDYNVASKVAYEYMVAGITTPTFSLSDPVTKAVDFKGLWLADADDVEGTLHQWPYGRARSAKQVSVASGAHHYAGRELPVIDYGLPREDVLTVEVEIPRGDNWEWRTEVDALEAFTVLRRPVTLRDNRGRVLHGAITNYSTHDTLWGTTASFSFTRLDKPETSVS